MKYLKRLKLKLLLKFINMGDWRDDEEEHEWLVAQWERPGFKSYIKVRDIEILKSIAIAVDANDYQTALVLAGRRQEILKMGARAKAAWLREDK